MPTSPARPWLAGTALTMLILASGCVRVTREQPSLLTEPAPKPKPPDSLLAIARQSVAQLDGWPDRGTIYEIHRHDGGWTVSVTRIEGTDAEGRPRVAADGLREIEIDDTRRVIRYRRVQ